MCGTGCFGIQVATASESHCRMSSNQHAASPRTASFFSLPLSGSGREKERVREGERTDSSTDCAADCCDVTGGDTGPTEHVQKICGRMPWHAHTTQRSAILDSTMRGDIGNVPNLLSLLIGLEIIVRPMFWWKFKAYSHRTQQLFRLWVQAYQIICINASAICSCEMLPTVTQIINWDWVV